VGFGLARFVRAQESVTVPSPRSLQRAAPAESVWLEPPDFRPPALVVPWVPPPMLVQPVPAQPFAGAVWVGGYWVWQRHWIWAHGLWAAPPQPGRHWVHPSYRHRGGMVIFVGGHWAPSAAAAQEPPRLAALSPPAAGAACPVGHADDTGEADGTWPRCTVHPDCPEGLFVPAPPGSRPGLVVPAPAGTAPAVVTGAPPITAAGMQVLPGAADAQHAPRLRIVAPAQATAHGQAVDLQVPALAHQAAALHGPGRPTAWAPRPRSELSVRFSRPAAVEVHARLPARQLQASTAHLPGAALRH
jgi:hypothetical protein